tara:strand:+ start:2456 stop:3121 length:666 start_codon:yes stop_codon:yes gene_type:complete
MTTNQQIDPNEDFSDVIDWDALFEQTETFKNNKPFRFAFVKGIFKQDFYDKLYQAFPKFNKNWFVNNDYRRAAKCRDLHRKDESSPQYDETISPEWNKFKRLICSNQFVENFSRFTGTKFSSIYESGFFANSKGDFQLPHIDEDGEYKFKLQIMFYFSKGWQKGDAGGTYLCESDDEDSIFFEPYDLDNSMVCFEETPHSWHGTRYITKDVVRQAASASLK